MKKTHKIMRWLGVIALAAVMAGGWTMRARAADEPAPAAAPDAAAAPAPAAPKPDPTGAATGSIADAGGGPGGAFVVAEPAALMKGPPLME